MTGPYSFALLTATMLAFAAPAAAADQPAECAGAASDVRLTVEVTGVNAAVGEMAVTVYPDDASRFLASGGKLARLRVPATAPATSACFNLPAAGYYAVAIYHDANANHDFDRTLVGFPDEGFGFSNDPQTDIGLPSFEEVRFPVKAGETLMKIAIKYP